MPRQDDNRVTPPSDLAKITAQLQTAVQYIDAADGILANSKDTTQANQAIAFLLAAIARMSVVQAAEQHGLVNILGQLTNRAA